MTVSFPKNMIRPMMKKLNAYQTSCWIMTDVPERLCDIKLNEVNMAIRLVIIMPIRMARNPKSIRLGCLVYFRERFMTFLPITMFADPYRNL